MAKPKQKKSVAKAKQKKVAPKAAQKKVAAKGAQKKASAKKAAPKKPVKAKASVKAKKTAKPAAKPAVKSAAKSAPVKAKAVKFSFSPLDDRILVQVEEGERVTAGGLFIPDSAMLTGNNRGVVVAVGPGHRSKKGKIRPTELRVGDRVMFSQYAGDEVSFESNKFKIIRETDVLGLVE